MCCAGGAFACSAQPCAGEAIELARALGELPPNFLVYAITGQRFTLGAGLSPAVKAAAGLMIEAIACQVRCRCMP